MNWEVFLPLLLYSLGAVSLVVLIILGIKLIMILDKVDKIVDNIDNKVNSLNNFFSIIDMTTDKLSLLSDRLVDGITFIIKKLFKPKNRKEEEINE